MPVTTRSTARARQPRSWPSSPRARARGGGARRGPGRARRHRRPRADHRPGHPRGARRHGRARRGAPDAAADGATPVVPEEGLNDIIEVPWDHITVGPDGRTLTVYFWSGAESCYGLAGVEVDETGAVPVITLQTGTRPGVEVCVALAQLYSTEVVLEQPIIAGGVQ